MPEIRKLLRLAPNAYAVTIPAKYRKTLNLGYGDYVDIHLMTKDFLVVRKHAKPGKI